MLKRFVAGLALLAILVMPLLAGDWPQWRGSEFDGTSPETDLPVRWTTTENIAWKLPLPERSGATPIVWGEWVFLNVAEGDDIYLWCIDRNSGKVSWKRFLSSGNHRKRKHNMSSPSPVTDGKVVYVMTGTGKLLAFDFEGKPRWSRDIQKDYGQFGILWGYASSPLLLGDALFVPVLHGMKTDDPSYILRINKHTGETEWRTERPTKAIRESPDSYTTPFPLRYEGKTEIVISGGDVVTGHDPETGKELWRGGGLNPDNKPYYRIVASPIARDGLIYVPTRVRPLLVYRAGGRGDITDTHLAWSTQNGPDVPTPVTDGKYYYVVNDKGIMYCFDARTGEEVYGGQRLQSAIYSASPVLADGKIYITSEEGVTSVVKTGPEFEILAENETDEYTLSSIAISDGQLFLRTEGHLYAIGKRKKQAANQETGR